MIRAIQTSGPGGVEVLKSVSIELGAPDSGEVLLRQTAIGVNLIDVYHRTATQGQYAIEHPAVLGVEAAGVIEEIGPDVSDFAIGDRVAYCMVRGAYAQKRLISASQLIRLPEFVSDQQAAACMVKGITANYLLHRIHAVSHGETVLVHAAAGGVGQILCQWARHLGATVIGTVGSPAKIPAAQAAGCDHVLLHNQGDFAAEVRALTSGRGVDVVYDSIGKDTFEGSLDCLRPLGMMVCYGQASGAVPPLDISLLAAKGSVFLAKPTLATFVRDPDELRALADGVFQAVKAGAIRIDIGHRASLDDVAAVHTALESRKLAGATVLTP
ncbi:MAG: quinone oxidoreductase [Alcaligenaceae bacterium]|nr:quinone oxidoreductase [Alcaligenaceae bacterium]